MEKDSLYLSTATGDRMFAFTPRIKLTRQRKTVDIVKRLGVITANRIRLRKYPVENPITAFNPALTVEDHDVIIYARVTLGYYTYASAVAEIIIPLKEFQELSGVYTATIRVFPDDRFDIWGVEDPRVYKIEGQKLMTYSGRTVNYFDRSVDIERTLPIAAIYRGEEWKKLCVFRLPMQLRGFVVSDKDAFFIKTRDGLRLFHRLHMKDDKYYLVISEISEDLLSLDEFKEITVRNTRVIIEQEGFEEKIGWGTPPIKINDEYLLFLHGVERELKRYRVFAMLMDEDLEVKAITPFYIMEPTENYEIFGDRPFTIFPCGAEVIDGRIIISYGAGDSSIAFGEIEVERIMELLDANRVD